ncbi:MAG: ribosome biogenesis GTPase Der [Alphaproteobacteria bacterium]|nr:MAG: ribosome biogenesis GTPase Der [Alphaproteobacteria bacterium]
MVTRIAIIGRPNVGKSTLFNRLAGRRLALVDKMPGLTRDRREADTEIGGHSVRIIDTAGLEEGEEGSLSARMRAQSEAALDEADLVLFVIDARTGIVPPDQAFAERVRASGKPVILVANKCEGRAGEGGYYDAFSLGLGEPVAISAEHGEGMGELLSAIAEACSRHAGDAEGQEEESAAGLRIAVVGRPNAGKSTLVNALLGEERMITGPEAGITRDSVATALTWEGRALQLHDTAGLRRKARIREAAEKLSVGDALKAIRFAEVVILVIDALHPFEKQDLQIASLVVEEGRALVIALNKWDLVKDKKNVRKRLEAECERLLPQVRGVPLVPVSALRGQGLGRLMEAVFRMHEIWNRRIPTAALNRWLEEAVARHTPPAVSGRRIRLRFMTQPHARPPTFVVFCSRPEKLPEAYRRYLINGLREAFDMPGVPIRLTLRKGKNPYVSKR